MSKIKIKIDYSIGKELYPMAPILCKCCNLESLTVDIGNNDYCYCYIQKEHNWYIVEKNNDLLYSNMVSVYSRNN